MAKSLAGEPDVVALEQQLASLSHGDMALRVLKEAMDGMSVGARQSLLGVGVRRVARVRRLAEVALTRLLDVDPVMGGRLLDVGEGQVALGVGDVVDLNRSAPGRS